MTDREKLTKLLRRWLAHLSLCAADDLIANGVTFATNTNDGGKWMPVTEMLPEEGESVLVCDAREDYVGEAVLQKGLVFMGKEFQGCWDWKGTSCRLDEFTHWMPLPEPPKEE